MEAGLRILCLFLQAIDTVMTRMNVIIIWVLESAALRNRIQFLILLRRRSCFFSLFASARNFLF